MIHVITHLSKPSEYTIPRVNPNINHRLWVIMVCQYRFTDCNKYTILGGMLIMREIMRETVHVSGKGAHGKSL